MTRILEDGDFVARYPRAREIVEFGRYHHHIQRYSRFRERGQLRLILQEDVAKKPVETVRALYEYLGVARDHHIAVLEKRPQAVVYNTTRLRGLHQVARLTNRYNANFTRSLGAKNPVARLFSAAYTRFDRIALEHVFPSQKPAPSDALMSRLSDIYSDDIDALERELGRDLGAWKQPQKLC